jgi:hypothetical protein
MWWKVIAFLYAFGYSWAVFDAAHDETAFRMITTAFLFPALVSLFLLAFDKRFLPKLFWKAYAIMFVAYWTFPLVLGAKTLIDASGILVYVAIIAACALFLLPVLRSLWWLSFARTEPGPPRLSEMVAP